MTAATVTLDLDDLTTVVTLALDRLDALGPRADPDVGPAVRRVRQALGAAHRRPAATDRPPAAPPPAPLPLDGLAAAADASAVIAPGQPAAHAAGHATEAQAATRVRLVAGTLRAKVLAELVAATIGPDAGGLTDVELEAALDLRRPTGGNRRGELVRLGLVERLTYDDGVTVTRPTSTGSPATVWRATARGIDAHRRLARATVLADPGTANPDLDAAATPSTDPPASITLDPMPSAP